MSNDSGDSHNKDEPSVKKSVKCGVCQELLSEEGWEEHCDTSHCSIAWRVGETIVSIYMSRRHLNMVQSIDRWNL